MADGAQEWHQIQPQQLRTHPDGAGHLRQPGEGIADEDGRKQDGQIQPQIHAQQRADDEVDGKQRSGGDERDEQAQCE